jgi:ornithine carbamoyltransferase
VTGGAPPPREIPRTVATGKRDLLSIVDIAADLPGILERAAELKWMRSQGDRPRPLNDCAVALIFEKPSTRTRSSFELAVQELGGHAVYLSASEMQLGRGETIEDTARVLSRYYDALVYRANTWTNEEELARWASVPVINALDDREHPCQVVADLLTLRERWGARWDGHRLAWIGDGDNVFRSLVLACAAVGLNLTAAVPEAYRPTAAFFEQARTLAARTGAKFQLVIRPVDAVVEADAVYTDVWVSMGDEAQAAQRTAAFQGYSIDDALLDRARPGAFALHDLPARRGLEISDAVMDGSRQAIWDQAENRLHAQKAILERLMTPVRA